ncbi:MAG: aminodeoxychorismate synthase component I [Pseudomonadota bacterium]
MKSAVPPANEIASLPGIDSTSCFALLDDAYSTPSISRLYSDLSEILLCADAHSWPEFFRATQAALEAGLHAVALLSYETGAQLQAIAAREGSATPSRMLLFKRCDKLDQDQLGAWLAQQEPQTIAGIANLRANVDEAAFSTAINSVRDYISAGDTYQVNYTYRLHFDTYGSPVSLYRRLRQRQPVPYGALICLPEGEAVLSLSPELFVRHQAGRLLARPMKGTAAATGDDASDQQLAKALSLDSKNRAENLMIVDLLRNDLGRIATTGSVTVPHLFEVNRFSSVLQMTSTIEANLQPDLPLAEIMSALFPCGSITGAPKHRTMEIIRELETEARGIYTGAIGWFDAPVAANTVGDFCLSVPIRTLALQAPDTFGIQSGVRAGVMGVGAGIVYDSNSKEEYAECQLKAKFLTGLTAQFSLFETMHASQAHGCRHLARHLQRLRTSAQYFGFPYNENAIRQALQDCCNNLAPEAEFRLRLSLHPNGEFELSSAILQALPVTVKILLAPQACQIDPLFLRHKSTVREQYDLAWQTAESQGAFDMLFCNQHGYVTEGGRSNVFIRKNGVWNTPPLSDGVLPGVMRAVILDDPTIPTCEKQLTLAEVFAADEVMLCNSLRGTLIAELIKP